MTVTATFAGVSTVLFSDGETAILTDGYFSRPSILRLAKPMRPDLGRIDAALARLGVQRLSAVLVGHSHVDHALDAPIVAQRTGAWLGGSPSTRLVQEGYGLADQPFRELVPGEPQSIGAFTLTPIASPHSHGDRVPGVITAPVTLPARTKAFRTGTSYAFHLAHADGSVAIVPSANFTPGMFDGLSASTLYLGAGAAGRQPEAWIRDYWDQTAGTLGARVVRPIHWDAFWRPLSKPLKPFPRPLDNLAVTLRVFGEQARVTGADVRLPVLWGREVCAE